MEIVSPDLIRSLGDLPLVTLALLLAFAQFVMMLRALQDMRREIRLLSHSLSRMSVVLEQLLLVKKE